MWNNGKVEELNIHLCFSMYAPVIILKSIQMLFIQIWEDIQLRLIDSPSNVS